MLKKSTALLLVLCTFLISVSSVLPVFAVTLGDVDGNGIVNASDYLLLKRNVLGTATLTSDMQSRSDMDGDGDVDKIDYIILKRTVLGVLESAPAISPLEVISYGKSYTTSRSASGTYPDTYNMELTDGNFASSPSYDNSVFCGFEGSVNIDVDLGTNSRKLKAFELSYLDVYTAGIMPPSSLAIYGSNNATNWTWLASQNIVYDISNSVETAKIEMAQAVNYRYIRFAVSPRSHWLFFDEVLVYASAEDTSSTTETDYYALDTINDATKAQYLASVSTGVAYDSGLGKTLISKSKSYTFDCAGYDSRCGYNATKLTDGNPTGRPYASEGFVGINATRTSSVTLNLGSVQSDLCTFILHCYNQESANIVLPEYVDVYVSSNNYSYTLVGRAYAPDTKSENHRFVISLNKLIKARYVRFTFPKADGYVWIEEAEVYANRHSGENIYGYFEMPLSEIPSYWTSSDDDYDVEQNLILGKLPEIRAYSDIAYSANNYKYNTSETSTLLTDGVTTDITDTEKTPWFGFYGSSGRNVFFDLGAISSVSGFSARILENSALGIHLPEYLAVYLSDNGKDWYQVSLKTLTAESKECIVVAEDGFEQSYRARYVMFDFDLDVHVYMDELTVIGKKNIKNSIKLENSGLTSTKIDFGYTYAAPSESLIGGAEDVCLFYFNTGTYDKNTVYPYVAYKDQNGNVVDTMFDSFLFLPGVGSLPSGGTPWGTNYASDWNYLYNEMFSSYKNFGALESVAGEVKNLLNKPDYKIKVFATIPHMDTTLTNFGDIDGDGVSENLTNINTRVYVAKYYAQKIMNKFNSMNYKNIELCGFYWFHEEISGTDATTAKQVNAAFDSIGAQLFWIPWYCAPGYNTWKTNGFDVCCMQPNYAFYNYGRDENGNLYKTITEQRLKDCADIAQSLGQCVEIEIHEDARVDDRRFNNYMQYLAGGVKYGYMDHAIHMYYQTFDTIGSMCESDDEKFHLIYDYTYQFIKGALDIKPDTVDDINIQVDANTRYIDTLNETNSKAVMYRVSQTPEHGSLAFDENGNYIYYPNVGFKGTDTFTYQISNHLGWSEDCTVTITVE